MDSDTFLGECGSFSRVFQTLNKLDNNGDPTSEEFHYAFDGWGRLAAADFALTPQSGQSGYSASYPAASRARACDLSPKNWTTVIVTPDTEGQHVNKASFSIESAKLPYGSSGAQIGWRSLLCALLACTRALFYGTPKTPKTRGKASRFMKVPNLQWLAPSPQFVNFFPLHGTFNSRHASTILSGSLGSFAL